MISWIPDNDGDSLNFVREWQENEFAFITNRDIPPPPESMRTLVFPLLTATDRNNDTVMMIDNGEIIESDGQREFYNINAHIVNARISWEEEVVPLVSEWWGSVTLWARCTIVGFRPLPKAGVPSWFHIII